VQQASTKLNEYWNALFIQGELYQSVGNEAWIVDKNDFNYGVCVKSEGQSYGMMICVMMNDQTRFMNLWRWTKNHMRHNTGSIAGRLAWVCNATTNAGNQAKDINSAPDGEIWMVTALHLAADKGWDSNLRQEANALCDVLLNKNPGTGLLPYFNQSRNLVYFVPITGFDYTDPSYAAPAFFSYLADKHNNGANRAQWDTLSVSHRKLIQDSTAINQPGLAADFTTFNGVPVRDHLHSYDAWRVTLHQTLDHLWNQQDVHIPKVTSALAFMSQGLNVNFLNTKCDANNPSYQGGAYQDFGQIAMYATGYKNKNLAEAIPFVEEMLSLGYVEKQYYQGLLFTLSLLILSDKFLKQ
jgi:oligosaccharide reducing-end xylanase